MDKEGAGIRQIKEICKQNWKYLEKTHRWQFILEKEMKGV